MGRYSYRLHFQRVFRLFNTGVNSLFEVYLVRFIPGSFPFFSFVSHGCPVQEVFDATFNTFDASPLRCFQALQIFLGRNLS